MSQPSPYARDYDFEGFQSGHPSTPLPGDKVNAELDAVNTAIEAILTNLALIQRDDTAVANKSIGWDQLKDELRHGFTTPTEWATGTVYEAGDQVYFGRKVYAAKVGHTSGTFSIDYNAGDWLLLADFTPITAVDQSAQESATDAANSAAEAATSAATATTKATAASTSATNAAASAAAAAADAAELAVWSATYDPNNVAGDAFDMDNMVEGADTKIMTAAERTKLAHITVAADIDLGNAVLNTATDASTFGFVVDEDDMASDSATKLPTQQSVKAYVDDRIFGINAADYGVASANADNTAALNALITAQPNARVIFNDDGAYAITSGAVTIPVTMTLIFTKPGGQLTTSGAGTLTNNANEIRLFGRPYLYTESINQGFSAVVNKTTGTATGNGNDIFQFQINEDSVDLEAGTGSKSNGLIVHHQHGGGTGGRQAINARLWQTEISNGSVDQWYVGAVLRSHSDVGDGGTAGSERGKYIGFNPFVDVSGDYVYSVEGGEIDTVFTGTGILNRIGLSVVAGDTSYGSVYDTAYAVGGGGGTVQPYKNGLYITGRHGGPGIASDGYVIHVDQGVGSSNSIGSLIKIESLVNSYFLEYTYAATTSPTRFGHSLLQLGGLSPVINLGSSGITSSTTATINFYTDTTGTSTDASIAVSGGGAAANQGIMTISAGTMNLQRINGITAIQLAGTASDPVLVRVNNTLKSVTEGAADSGGTGFKVLRVPN